MFLEIEPCTKELLESDLGSHSGGEEPEAEGETAAELESLRTVLAEAKSLNEVLAIESKSLQDDLKRLKEGEREGE